MTKALHTHKKSRDLATAITHILIVTISVFSIAGPTVWFATAQSLPPDPQPTCVVTAPVFASWFHAGAVSKNGVVDPANSVTFPGNVANNCNFYRWSEQMFLWLTSPTPRTYGGGGGHIFDSPVFFDVSPPVAGVRTFILHSVGGIATLNVRAAQVGAHGLPVIMAKGGMMFEVEPPTIAPSGKQLILNRSGRSIEIESATLENGKPVLRDKAGMVIPTPKAIIRPQLSPERTVQRVMIGRTSILLNSAGNVIDTEEGQADGAVLEAQNGSLIYYQTTWNDFATYFLTGVKNGVITPGTQFPTTQSELNQVVAYASAHGVTFPDPNALAIEVKSAWIETTGLANLSSYITKKATVPIYTKTANQWIPTGQTHTVTVALLAMHVVGSAAFQPPMIWATFEHFGNTPNAAYQYNSTSGLKTVPQTTAGNWLFCASGSNGPFNVPHMHTVPFGSATIVGCNAGNPCGSVNNQTISPSDSLRFKPFGGASNASPNPLDPTVAASNTEIISINNSVRGQLVSGDPRLDYYMVGSTWTIGGFAPTSSFGNPGNPGATNGKAVGTSQLVSMEMETYQQVNTLFNANSNNCFSCHVTKTTSVSHVYASLKPLF